MHPGQGCTGFKETGMIEWGGCKNQNPQKSLGLETKPKKLPGPQIKSLNNPMPNFRAIKLCGGTTRPGNVATITNLQIGLNTPKSPYLNQATPKKYLPKFSYPKKSRNQKFQIRTRIYETMLLVIVLISTHRKK